MGATATTVGRIRATDATSTRQELLRAVEWRVTISQWIAHTCGAFDVVLLLFFVLPYPVDHAVMHEQLVPNGIGLAIYVPLSMVIGTILGRRAGATRMAWLLEEREPTPDERARTLRGPNLCFKLDAALWLVGALIFGAINLPASPELAAHVASTVVLGGLTVCAVAYLLTERYLRPVTALALAAGPPARPAWPGVEGRVVLSWLLATGMPLLGLINIGIDGLIHDRPAAELARGTLVLGLLAFVTGITVMLATARTVARPLTSVRKALGRVQAGDLATEVRVSDGSEIGLLQSGFNSMVMGLRDRERMQDLYARQVGEDVARVALADEPRLGGEVREIAVLFVDVIGSTEMAVSGPPERVVARLNRFFSVVVDVTAAHGGWVNKFEGDAALCVFGAPADCEDAAGCALASGRELQKRLARDVPGLEAAVGLSAGPAVAGWVGALQRFEYTVIGDPVNVASRLCELAKRRPGRLVASEAIVTRARPGERERWQLGETEVLRGRSTPTRLAQPVDALVAG